MKAKTEKVESTENLDIKQEELPKLKVELNVKEWELVLAVIENSTSPHLYVKSVATELVKQLQPQIKSDDKS